MARQAQLLKQIAEILDKFKASTGDYLQRAFLKLVEHESQLAVEDLQEFRDALKLTEAAHIAYNQRYVQQVFEDTFASIAGQTDRMEQSVKAELRKDSREVFRLASIEGTTRAQAYRTLRDTILGKDPDFRFIDRAGRKWDGKTYFNMLTHTVMSSTQRDIYANTLAKEGHDLVKVSNSGAQDACRNWEGKILSLTGSTPGYPTVAEATATGEIFHPNCRHRLLAYDKDIEDIFQQEGK